MHVENLLLSRNRDDFDNEININNYSDLLLYNNSNLYQNKESLLSGALKRFSAGDLLLTITEKNKLVHYAWMSKNRTVKIFPDDNIEFIASEECIILYDIFTDSVYCHQGFCKNNIRRMINESIKYGAKIVFIGAYYNNTTLRNVIENSGFPK